MNFYEKETQFGSYKSVKPSTNTSRGGVFLCFKLHKLLDL